MEDEESDSPIRFQRKRAVSSTVNASKLSTKSSASHKTVKTGDQKMGTDGNLLVEKEEGEWSDDEGLNDVGMSSDVNSCLKGDNSNGNPKRRLIKGNEATHALKLATHPGKRPKVEQQKDTLGKKHNRQTVFLNLEDVKQAGPAKISTPRKPNFLPPTTRITKESRSFLDSSEGSGEKVFDQSNIKDTKQVDQSNDEGNSYVEPSGIKSECSDSDMNSGSVTRSKRTNSGINLVAEDKLFTDHKPSPLKQSTDSRQMKSPHVNTKRVPLAGQNQFDSKTGVKKLPSRKPTTISTQHQDSSVERLLREVTKEKYWQHPGNSEVSELQCVPGSFESVEEYVRVFEPLLFEECRAQLYSTWEELTETVSRDLHTMVRIKNIERRERGWYDVILLATNECRWNFKEGDVAVLSAARPGTVKSKRTVTEETTEVSGRVAGTVRRHIPIDTRDPILALLHFYVGDSYDSSSKVDDDCIINKLQRNGVWYLTILGALATTQREYIALHAFRRLNSQMQNAILQPSPDQFPKYEEQSPTSPECFTTNFVDHLHRSFNGPQLSAIHWAAMHTAAGTNSNLTKKQDPWLNVAAYTGRAEGSMGVDPDVLMARDQNRDSLLQNLAAAVENRDKVLVELSRLSILHWKFTDSIKLEDARARLEASFANEAEIVFTTVSSSGRKLFSRLTHGFDMVVIDEAAQASEVGVLPPLALGAARCVLVGDPQQLPATVISKAAGTLLYSRSLFERFQQAGCPTILLSVQYRMHPQIRDFPSRYFYQGRLTDSESVTNLPDEFYYKDPLLRPYIFYDITHGRESHRGGSVSYQNVHEAQFCLRLYEHLQKTVKILGMPKVSVGIITPYKLQLKCIQREFEEVLNSEEGKDLYINTVDAFQGQERDVIIMSCVRASGHGVGFVADIRRMNVALTRARRALWVMGNASSLVQSDDWAALIADAKARKSYMDMDSLPIDFFAAPKAAQLPPPPPPPYGPPPPRFSNTRGFTRPAFRQRLYDPRRGASLGDGDKADASSSSRNGGYLPFNKPPLGDRDKADLSSTSRNGGYLPFNKPPLEDFVNDFDRSRYIWQHGTKKTEGSNGVTGKRDQ
ncbi:putative P-loop containing nucleoside triphosphate hydrolase, DNA2/NAM7 helicase, helicase [Helianthus annuus]|nr:putative P-loop containing nucleoside triphosphate hydrolase, DNA2/NAM7 helicase, helicase [Helianthus annuus]